MLSFNIAGAFTFKFLPIFIKNNTHKKYNITVYDGVNNCKWNGGRINRNIIIEQKDIELYNKFGISVCLVFSNDIIDLTDPIGNKLLNWLNESQIKYNIKNEIVLVNDNFRIFLRNNYNFILKFSITGHNYTSTNNIKNYYYDLENNYDLIVPKMEDVFKDVFNNNDKYELMLNDTCVPYCSKYNEHFLKINEVNRTINKTYYNINKAKEIEECWIKNFDPNIPQSNEKYGMDFTKGMLNKAIHLGFNKFKISGRENNINDIINDINKYMDKI